MVYIKKKLKKKIEEEGTRPSSFLEASNTKARHRHHKKRNYRYISLTNITNILSSLKYYQTKSATYKKDYTS